MKKKMKREKKKLIPSGLGPTFLGFAQCKRKRDPSNSFLTLHTFHGRT
jgi:hypothetical protein